MQTASELEADLAVSRATVHRATASLAEQGLLVECDDGFALTGYGVAVAEEARSFRTNVATAERLAPFLDVVDPETAADFPLDRFADARVTTPEPRRAHVGVERLRELAGDSETPRLFSRVVSPVYVDVAYRAVMDGKRVEAVFDPEVVEIFFADYADKFREAADVGDFSVRVCDGCPFELFVFDAAVGVTARDERALDAAFVETDDSDARKWAENLFERYAASAEFVTVF